MNKSSTAHKNMPSPWILILAPNLNQSMFMTSGLAKGLAKGLATVLVIVLTAAVYQAPNSVSAQPANAALITPPSMTLDATSSRSITDLFREYEADRNNTHSFFSLPASEAYLNRLERMTVGWQERLTQVNFDALDQAGRVDYLWLGTKLRESLDDVSRQRKYLAEMAPLLAFRAPIETLEEARWRTAPLDCEAAATSITAMADQIKRLRERVEAGNKLKTEKSKTAPADSAAALTATAAAPAATAAALDPTSPTSPRWLKKPYEEAAKQMEDYAKLLREEVAQSKGKDDDPLIGDPLGAESLSAQIRSEWLAYSAEELIAIGEREFEWCEREMKSVSREMNLGDDWKAALAKVKSDFALPGQQDELIAQIAREAIEFVRQRKMVTVPELCEQTWRLSMLSPETMKTIPYAAYSRQHVMVAYASEEMKHEDKMMTMRGNNRHFMRAVIPHELIPGHHLQGFNANRLDGFRGGTPFFVEGWALYCEMRLWELGWPQTPEDRIGMLFWRLHRSARVIVSLKYHLGQMTPAQMVDFLVARVGHEKSAGASEVRRFLAADPLYQCSYLIGALQFRALRLEATSGGKMTEQQFHDAILRSPSIPLELLHARLFNVPLTRIAKPSWRFAK
ncbi:MAG: DUF885 family protein [Candidatus Sumerlaeota bacterium]|nr:DUF885 family protein [Candidatus Sumerlaeota bacterium]